MPEWSLLFALDLLSVAATLIVAGFFLRLWARTGANLYVVFAIAFGLIGVSYGTVSTAHFDLERPERAWDLARAAGQLGGAVLLLFAYVTASAERGARLGRSLVATLLALVAVAAVLVLVFPPRGAFPSGQQTWAVVHGLMVVANAGCAAAAVRGALHRPSPDALLVPAAFVAWTLAKYTWFLLDLTSDGHLVGFAYFWRFVAIALLVAAVALPARRDAEVARAAA